MVTPLGGGLGAEGGDRGGVGGLADIGVAVGQQDDAGEGGFVGLGQQRFGAGLPATVQVGGAAGVDLGQRGVEGTAVADRPAPEPVS